MSLHRLSPADRRPSVGRDTDAWCTRCKMTLGHTITAMVGYEVVRVTCNTCGSDHKYRGSKDATAAKTTRRRSATAATSSGAASTKTSTTAAARAARTAAGARDVHNAQYERRMRDRDPAEAVDYAPSLAPAAGQLIRHPKFGVGLVEAVSGTKANILFRDGPRTLVVNR